MINNEREVILKMRGGDIATTKWEFGEDIVRCKDCKYKPGNSDGYVCKLHSILGIYMEDKDNFFCRDGKRMEEDIIDTIHQQQKNEEKEVNKTEISEKLESMKMWIIFNISGDLICRQVREKLEILDQAINELRKV